MSISLKPAQVPTSLKDGAHPITPQSAVSPQTSAAIALNMSWQLLIVLLVPTIGGHYLDEKLTMSPLWTIIGGLFALTGCVAVVWQAMRQLDYGKTEKSQ